MVTNQEPTAMTDAYALMKVLSTKSRVNRFKLLVNEVSTAAQAKDVFKKLSLVSDQYLNIGIDYLGFIYSDKQVSQSVRKQAPFLSVFPDSPASRCVEVVSERLLKDPRMKGPTGNMQFFFNRLLDHSDLS